MFCIHILIECHHLSSYEIYVHETKCAMFRWESLLHQRCFDHYQLVWFYACLMNTQKICTLSRFFPFEIICIKQDTAIYLPKIKNKCFFLIHTICQVSFSHSTHTRLPTLGAERRAGFLPFFQELDGQGNRSEAAGRTGQGKPPAGSGRRSNDGHAVSHPQGSYPLDPRVCLWGPRLHVRWSCLQSFRRRTGTFWELLMKIIQ